MFNYDFDMLALIPDKPRGSVSMPFVVKSMISQLSTDMPMTNLSAVATGMSRSYGCGINS